MPKRLKRFVPADWLAILKTLARSDEFQPFIIWVSVGEYARRLLVPHPSTLRFPRSGRTVQWDHGRDGKLEFDPRYVVKVDLQLDPEELTEVVSPLTTDPKRRQRRH
jgi:hypothetical protein